MKNKLLLFLLGIMVIPQTIFSQVPSYVPSNGLVGYWPFSGNANDVSGNGYDGTVNGATLTADRFGNSHSAYNFDGVNDYIEVQNSQNLNSPTWTISAWINVNGFYFGNVNGNISYGNMIVGKGTDFNSGFYGLSYSSQSLKVVSSYGVGSQANGVESTTNITLNNWINVIGTWDGANMKIYVNGQLENVSSNFSNNPDINDENLFFGTMAQNNLYPYWLNGKIDDIGIWNRALTQQEITAMYNGVNYSDTCNAVSGSLTQGLVGYWPFCGNANDDSGNGNNGTVNGATLTTDRFGNANSAYSFSSSPTGQYIQTPLTAPIGVNPRTLSIWYQQTQSNNPGNVWTLNGWGDNSPGRAFAAVIKSDKVGVDTSSSLITYQSNNTIGDWHNLVLVFDNSFGNSTASIKIYLDGVFLNTIANSVNPNTLINTGSLTNFFIGSFSNNQFIGKIDDVGIWNRALTQQEITQLFNQNQCFTNITVTDTLVINVGQLSFTNPISYSNNITIAPNPASTQININFNNITDLSGGSIKIINSLGQQVATTPITATGTNTTMQLNTWGGTGMYFVQIVNGQGIVVDVKKIILQ